MTRSEDKEKHDRNGSVSRQCLVWASNFFKYEFTALDPHEIVITIYPSAILGRMDYKVINIDTVLEPRQHQLNCNWGQRFPMRWDDIRNIQFSSIYNEQILKAYLE